MNKRSKVKIKHFVYLFSFLSVLLPLFCCYKFFKDSCCKELIVPSTIIISLLPVIASICIMAISFGKDKLLGTIDRKDLNKLRSHGQFYITYFEFILITIISFIFESFASYFSKDISLLILDIWGIIYSVWFCYQEIPVLMENEKRILKILKHFGRNII